jgi:hypothetical protein
VADSASDQTDLAVDYFKQWQFNLTTKGLPMLSKASFDGPAKRNFWLKNKVPRKFLQHEKQSFGINLGWTDDAEPSTGQKVARWFVARKDDADGHIRYGDWVALGNGRSPSFIRYAERDVGINLDWSDFPVFEWKLLGGPIGTDAKTGEYLAIYNAKAKEPLVYFDRTAGGDIGWPSSKTWGKQLEERVVAAVKEYGPKAVAVLLAA